MNSNDKCEKLYNSLKHKFENLYFLHEKSPKIERSELIKNLKNEKPAILITMDYLGRGLNLKNLNLIINYDLPDLKNNYVHRIGRAGRFNVRGTAISFLSQFKPNYLDEFKKIHKIQKYQC